MNTRARTVTPDQAAIEILLSNVPAAVRQARLTKLARQVAAVVACCASCPDCGHRGPHESNDDRVEPMLCCVECGCHFEQPEIRLGGAS